MSFRRYAGGGKRDTAEAPIVKDLRALGVYVKQIGGKGNPDILTLWHDRWLPMEIKTNKGRLTKAQQDEGVGVRWPVVRTTDEARAALGIL